MPEFVKSNVGSFAGTSDDEGTIVWPLLLTKSRNAERISEVFIEVGSAEGWSVRPPRRHPRGSGNPFRWIGEKPMDSRFRGNDGGRRTNAVESTRMRTNS